MNDYQRGFEDAKRRAVEKVEKAKEEKHFTAYGLEEGMWARDAIAAIRAIEPPGEETHEERWLALGYRVEWSEREPRSYEVRRVGCCPRDNDCLARLPTVHAVDAWIAAHKRETR
jgi:hypothetical protein